MNNSNQPKNNQSNTPFIAFLFILMGAIFLLKNLGILPYGITTLLLSWKTMIVAIGCWMLYRRQPTAGIVLIVVGLFFMFPNVINLLPANWRFPFNRRIMWPVALIAFGLYLYYNSRKKAVFSYEMDNGGSPSDASSQAEYIYKSTFLSSEILAPKHPILGGAIRVTLGDLVLNLKDASIQGSSITLPVESNLASLTIIVPEIWMVEIMQNNTLGNINDERISKLSGANLPTLRLNCNCVMGSIRIIN